VLHGRDYPGDEAMADNLTPDQRSYCMSRVRGRDTDLERIVRSELHKRGLRFRKHVKELPGRPDVVFPGQRVAVFVDGDFWHGYGLPTWEAGLSEFWKCKLWANRKRDKSNFAKLRYRGWSVIRLWQHEVEGDLGRCIDRIQAEVARK
jgi:DNA mismatch endonuclease, patch repair protein